MTDQTPSPSSEPEETFAASRRDRMGRRCRASIPRDLFEAVKKSDEGLGDILDIEEAYEANLGNFIDYERGVTAQLATELVHPATDLEQIDHARRTIGRLLDNLLSTSFSFLEQTRLRMTRRGGRELGERFKAEYADIRNRLPALAVVEAIRNYAQHEGSSVSGISLGGRRLEEGAAIVIERTLVATVRRDLIKPDRRAPKAAQQQLNRLLDDVADDKGRIEMGPLIRHYIAALSEVLIAARLLVAERQAHWSLANRDAIAALGTDEGYSHQVLRLRGARSVESSPIVLFNVERIERLQARNRVLTGLPLALIRH